MFKKLPFILMTLTFVLVLAACGSKNDAGTEGAASNGSGKLLLSLAVTFWQSDRQHCYLW